MEEFLLLKSNVIEYVNWNFMNSIVVNISAMIMLSWFTIIILNRGRVNVN